MRVIWKGLIAGAFVVTAVALSQTHSRNGPAFTKDGDLVLPTGFREWVFMGGPITPNSLNGGEAPFPEFHDVYIERENLLYYQHYGNFAETLCGILLIAGFKTRLASVLSGLLLLAFAIGMVTGLGIKKPLDYSVFSAAAAAFLLAFWEPDRFTLDALLNRFRN